MTREERTGSEGGERHERPRPGGRRRAFRRVGDLLPAVASQLGLDEELRLARAAATWQRLIEEQVPAAAGATRLMAIRPPRLIVSADDSAVAAELRLHAATLLDAFAVAPGGARLEELRAVVGGRPSGLGWAPR
jgi:predicted nucleic acid-binding Zn ribbon protein